MCTHRNAERREKVQKKRRDGNITKERENVDQRKEKYERIYIYKTGSCTATTKNDRETRKQEEEEQKRIEKKMEKAITVIDDAMISQTSKPNKIGQKTRDGDAALI